MIDLITQVAAGSNFLENFRSVNRRFRNGI